MLPLGLLLPAPCGVACSTAEVGCAVSSDADCCNRRSLRVDHNAVMPSEKRLCMALTKRWAYSLDTELFGILFWAVTCTDQYKNPCIVVLQDTCCTSTGCLAPQELH